MAAGVNKRGRKSPSALAAAGRDAPRDAIWTALRAAGALTLKQAAVAGDCDESSARSFFLGLIAAGIMTVEEASDSPAKRYRLIEDRGPITPRVRPDGVQIERDLRAAAWAGMRILKAFSLMDLHVSTGITLVDARDYCRILAKAGYLRCTVKGVAGRPTRYVFVQSRYTGPKPPQVKRTKVVYDPNTQEIAWSAVAAEGRGDE